MNRSKLKTYAPQARRDFIQAVTDRAAVYGLTKDSIEPITERGDVAIIAGKPFPRSVVEKRNRLADRIQLQGFDHVMEAMAYTWFNRLVAIRYMELHGYLDHGYRAISHPDQTKIIPEIVEHAEHVDLPGLETEAVLTLKLDGNKEAELFRMLLIAQCNALSKAMPFLFERINDETELLLPDNLLHSDSIVRKLVTEIDEEDWQQVEIIGWLYQFYISEKKDEVIGKVVRSEDIPAATQLFTPNWIVKYLVQNSLGRQWMATYPDSPLKQKMEFYIEPAEQSPEVQARLKAITPESLNPEELTMMDPACGSGHILVEGYDLLKEIYLERGYRLRDIPKLILTKNLFGLEIDDRAAQLAAFALMMKARADDRRVFEGENDQPGPQPNVLAIQESNGLNINAIVQAFTDKKLKNEGDTVAGEFGFMEGVRAPLFATENSVTATVDDKLVADLKAMFSLFENAKTYGSLITVPQQLADRLPAILKVVQSILTNEELAVQRVARTASVFLAQSLFLARLYGSVVTNPPYMGGKLLNPALRAFARRFYPNGQTDLFAAFILRCSELAVSQGRVAMVTMHSWMFLSTYEKLRRGILTERTIETLAHLGPRAFGAISGEVVQVAAFVFRNDHSAKFRPIVFRLLEGDEEQKRSALEKRQNAFSQIAQDEFTNIPGSPVAYWISPAFKSTFERSRPLETIAPPRVGMATSNNAQFVRLWQEVDFRKVGIGFRTAVLAQESGRKWFPYNKGGEFRRWYGNNSHVVNWYNDGEQMKDAVVNNPRDPNTTHWSRRIFNTEFFFRPSITWSLVAAGSFSARHSDAGYLFDVGGSSAFPSESQMGFILGLLCSKLAPHYLRVFNPTMNFQPGNIGAIPVLESVLGPVAEQVSELAAKAVALSRQDWNLFERSWAFERHPLIIAGRCNTSLEDTFEEWRKVCEVRTEALRDSETKLNELLISSYGMASDLSPSPDDGELRLHIAHPATDSVSLVSYALGCAMGRYTLQKPGLIYANSGNEGFDLSQYEKFPADKDGIIPATEIDWFSDDAAHRFEEFVGVAWPQEYLEENLKFVAESLGTKSGEQPRDTIRLYFANDFYKHHLQTYKRRPIYWLFTSGKLRAFQCLVYLHRYNEGTLARMRTEYVIPLQGKINSRIDQLEGDKSKATSTSHRKKIEKEQELLKKHQTELVKFDDKLRHYADQRITLDLDDGVKVNYGKFGDLLANVTQVCGKGEDD